jgi:hypothetical protein
MLQGKQQKKVDMFINKSKHSGFLALAAFISLLVVILLEGHVYQNNSVGILPIGVLFLLALGGFISFCILRQKEKAAAFKEAFGIDIPNYPLTHSRNHDEFENLQVLVNRKLTEKAKAFADARILQQQQFGKGKSTNSKDAEMSHQYTAELLLAKRAFWDASDIARHYMFQVKEKYSEWLEVPTIQQ